MNGYSIGTAIGAGVTTFLVVTVFFIEVLAIEFSAIVAVPIGVFAALFAAVVVLLGLTDTSPGVRRAVRAYAVFGLTVLVLLLLGYVNVGRGILSVEVVVGSGLFAAGVASVVLLLRDRNTRQ